MLDDDTIIFCSYQDINVRLADMNIELQKHNTWYAVNNCHYKHKQKTFHAFLSKENSLSCIVKINNVEINKIYHPMLWES